MKLIVEDPSHFDAADAPTDHHVDGNVRFSWAIAYKLTAWKRDFLSIRNLLFAFSLNKFFGMHTVNIPYSKRTHLEPIFYTHIFSKMNGTFFTKMFN